MSESRCPACGGYPALHHGDPRFTGLSDCCGEKLEELYYYKR